MAVTNEDIVGWFYANPGASDELIAATMQAAGVSPEQLAQATGADVGDVTARFEAAVPVAPPAEVSAPAQTYTSTDETGAPIYDYVASVYEPPSAPVYEPVYEPPSAPVYEPVYEPPPPAAVYTPPPAPVVTPPPAPTGALAQAAAPAAVSTPPTIASLTDAYNRLGATETTYTTTEQGEQANVLTRDLGGGFGAWTKPGEVTYIGDGESATPVSAPATLGGFMSRDADKKLTNYYDTQGNFLFAEKDQSLTSQILSDLSPVISMVVPFLGAELGAMLNVSAATGTAIVKAGL